MVLDCVISLYLMRKVLIIQFKIFKMILGNLHLKYIESVLNLVIKRKGVIPRMNFD